MVIVKSESEYAEFLSDINRSILFLEAVVSKSGIHNAINDVLCLFIYNHTKSKSYCLNLSHQDCKCLLKDKYIIIKDILKKASKTFVLDKKKYIHLFKENDFYDLLITEFQTNNTKEDVSLENCGFLSRKFGYGDKFIYLNQVLPLVKQMEIFEEKYKQYKDEISTFHTDKAFSNINGIITETLAQLESNGLCVNPKEFNKHFGDKGVQPVEDKVYTEYNIFTSTGRPSNRFFGINYAALNKEDGCRKSFVSRFGKDGMLLVIDYSAYHPHIIANLVNYKDITFETDVYDFLGRLYLKKDKLTEADIKKSKNITFQNLYGGIRKEYRAIPFFKEIEQYIEHRWKFFKENGYVETPVWKRKITDKHIVDANPNKLFNYILQASETEFSLQNINRVNEYLKNKKTCVILYTYDAILLDACKDDKHQTLKDVKQMMIDNQFPVKCYSGNNYHEMSLISL